jgi:hypothetical protein
MTPSIPTRSCSCDLSYSANAQCSSCSRMVGENEEIHDKRSACNCCDLQETRPCAFLLYVPPHGCCPRQPFRSRPTEARSAPIPTPNSSFPAPLLNWANSCASSKGAVWIPKILANAPPVANTPFVDVVLASTAPTTVEAVPSAIAPTTFASAPIGLTVNATPAASRRREPALLPRA